MKETTIAYQVTNIVLRNEIYGNWDNFIKNLNSGPEVMKQELLNMWNNTREILTKQDNIEILDLDKEVTKESFDITMNTTEDGLKVFYFIFPDADIAFAQCKCVALALTPKAPRYFTMEYFSKEKFVFGEWTPNGQHSNYGSLDNPTIECFAKNIYDKIEKND